MKQFIALALCAMPLAGFAQLHVSTEPQPRVALLEEFTGMRCVNCPDGHAIANDILAARPGEFIPVNLHAGAYANPRPGDPDYTTDYGNELLHHLKVQAFPTGTMNRVAYNGNRVIGRDVWREATRLIVNQTSPVNLWCEANYDDATGNLKIDVEGYFTSDLTDPDLNLNVLLLQDNIEGPQTPHNHYVHNHMLRTTLTGLWGEAVNGGKAGESFTTSYTYKLPADFKGVECKPQDMQVVVTINRGKDEVITATEARPQSESFPHGVDATLMLSRFGTPMLYAYNFIDLRVQSNMPDDITTLTISTRANYDEWVKHEVECLIPRGQVATVTLPVDYKIGASGMSRLSARLEAINGVDIEHQELWFSFICPTSYDSELTFEIQTDRHASDNRFLLRDTKGEIVKEFGPYPEDKAQLVSETLTLDPGFYCFEISDSWGDGIAYPDGWVRIYRPSDQKDFLHKQTIASYGARLFFRVPDDKNGIESVDAAASANLGVDRAARRITVGSGSVAAITVVAADGRTVASGTDLSLLPAGIYVARATMADGSVATLKFAL